MANRSDFSSTLPRRFKRMLILGSTGDAHQDGNLRRLYIQAHAHHKSIQKKNAQFLDPLFRPNETNVKND